LPPLRAIEHWLSLRSSSTSTPIRSSSVSHQYRQSHQHAAQAKGGHSGRRPLPRPSATGEREPTDQHEKDTKVIIYSLLTDANQSSGQSFQVTHATPPIHSTDRTSHSRNSPRATRNAMRRKPLRAEARWHSHNRRYGTRLKWRFSGPLPGSAPSTAARMASQRQTPAQESSVPWADLGALATSPRKRPHHRHRSTAQMCQKTLELQFCDSS
jgi:hypothetical protein